MTTPAKTIPAPLRVLHVIASMSAREGGPPAVCAGLTGALAARGHQVTIATLDEPGHVAVPIDPRVTVQRFACDGSKKYASSTGLDAWLRGRVKDSDLIHLHSIWLFPTFAAARACWAARKPYVVLLNGMLDHYSVHHRSYLKKRLYWLLRERRIASRAAGIHCLNAAEYRRAVPWIAGMPKFILPNGIDAAQLAALPPPGGFRAAHPELAGKQLVLFLSRLHPKKGLDRLIPAWKSLAGKVPAARLLIAGTGEADYVNALQNLVKQNSLADRVLFLGQLTGSDKWQALVDADVFVLPSYQEGFSMAITEALAAGLPPVVTEECNFDELACALGNPPGTRIAPKDNPGSLDAVELVMESEAAGLPLPPELLERNACLPLAGIIIEDGDMSAFTAAVADLLQNPAKRQTLAASGRALVAERFTWQKIAADLEGIYRLILVGQRLPVDPGLRN